MTCEEREGSPGEDVARSWQHAPNRSQTQAHSAGPIQFFFPFPTKSETLVSGMSAPPPSRFEHLSQEQMIDHICATLCQERSDAAPYTLILGAGGSTPIVPTAREMIQRYLPEWLLRPHERRGGIPAALRWEEGEAPEPGATSLAPPVETKIKGRARFFWESFCAKNPGLGLTLDKDGLPDDPGAAYRHLFSGRCGGGMTDLHSERRFFAQFNPRRDGKTRLNATHFYLASILGLQPPRKDAGHHPDTHVPYFIGYRPFLQTILTTNFDPLLQVSLQAVNLLYYMTDRNDGRFDPEPADPDSGTLHLLYVHGSVHHGDRAHTDGSIEKISRHRSELVPFLQKHGVIVVGYSGWDDCLLQALEECPTFDHNLYWCARSEDRLPDRVRRLLAKHSDPARAFFVKISDGGQLFAALHAQLCPGLIQPELLQQPIPLLRRMIEGIDLTGIAPYEAKSGGKADKVTSAAGEAAPSTIDVRTPAEQQQQTLKYLDLAHAHYFQQKTRSELVEAEKASVSGAASASAGVASKEKDALVEPLLRQADLRYLAGEFDFAFTLYDHLLQNGLVDGANAALALSRRGVGHGKAGRDKEAIADCTRVIEMKDAPNKEVARALINRGVCHGEAGRNEEAIADYTRVIEMKDAPSEQVAIALNNRGRCHDEAGRNEEAIADYTRVAEMKDAPNEEVARAFNNRGWSHGQAGRHEEAIADCTRVIETKDAPSKEVARALINRGWCHGEAGRHEEEIADCTRVIEMKDTPSEQVAKAYRNRGLCHGKAGRNEEEIADYTHVIEMKDAPSEEVAKALNNRGVCHDEAGRNEEAKVDYTRVIEMKDAPSEQVAKALNNRGWSHFKAGRHEEAIADYTRVIEMKDAPSGEVARALYNRGLRHKAKKDARAAKEDWEKVIALGDAAGMEALRSARAELEKLKEG